MMEVGLLKICTQNHEYKQKEGRSRKEGQRGSGREMKREHKPHEATTKCK